MKNPSISVIMATYNGGNYLNEQIDSILAQTLPAVEIIVCDDNSSDNTIEILRSYADRKLLRYYVNENRLGVIGNFKKAASLAANSNFFALADQDDLWAPDKLMKLANIMIAQTDNSMPAMVFSDANIIDKEGHLLNKSLWNEFTICPDKQTFKTLLIRNIVPGCTMLINSKMRTELLNMPNNIYMHDAWITFVAYLFRNIKHTKEALTLYRRHENNVTYSEAASKSSTGIILKIAEYINGIFFDKKLLKSELEMAEIFFNDFGAIMNVNDKKDFEDFMIFKNKNFIFKKLHIRLINKIERP